MLELPLIAALLLVRGRPFATSLLSVMKLVSQMRCLTSDWTQSLDSAFVKPLADPTLQSPLLMHSVSLKCLVISIAMELTAEKGKRRNPAPCTWMQSRSAMGHWLLSAVVSTAQLLPLDQVLGVALRSEAHLYIGISLD